MVWTNFAGVVTTLAMQKPSTNVRSKIFPSCVFQLQCIVDSWMVSRGWSICAIQDHVLIPPATAFRPRRDIDLFLDRKRERLPHGYFDGLNALRHFMKEDAMLQDEPDRYELAIGILTDIRFGFMDYLGESKYMHDLDTDPPSRFSNSNSNGLWE